MERCRWPLVLLFCCWALATVAGVQQLTIVHTGDSFYQVVAVTRNNAACAPTDDARCFGGYARLATVLSTIRTNVGPILLVDSGSFLGGSLFSYQFGSSVAAEYYRQFGYNAVAITTREFFNGVDTLAFFLRNSSIPGICSNMDVTNEPRLNGYIIPYKIFTIGPSNVVVGFTSEVDQELKAKVSDSGNVTVTESIAGLQKAVGQMLDQGVNLIVVALATTGIDPLYVLDNIYGIDVLLVRELPANNTPVVHTTPWGAKAVITGVGSYGQYYSRSDLTATDSGLISTAVAQVTRMTNSTPSDATVKASIINQYAVIQASFSNIVGSTTTDLDGSNCELQECGPGNLNADIMRAHFGSQIGITNGGSIRSSIPQGNITLSTLVTVFQFDQANTISLITLTGADIFASIESGFSLWDPADPDGRFPQVSGLRVYWNPTQPPGLRTVRVFVENGDGSFSPLSNSSVYSVATNSFMRSGLDGYTLFKTNAITAQDFGPFITSLQLSYLADNSPVTVTVGSRLIVTNELRPDPNAVPQDNYYVDWGDYPAIILVIVSFLFALFLCCILIFVIASVRTNLIKETSISFHVVQLVSMIISCFIIYIFVGTPSDGYCALRPWTSLLFTLVFGNLVAKQISTTIQSIEAMVKKENDSILHVKYNPLLLLRNLAPFLVVNLVYLIIWTAVDYPSAGSQTASGEYNSQLTCRSDPDVPWLVILFFGFAVLMLIGVVCSLWLHHVSIMYREADKIGIALYLASFEMCILIILYNSIRDFPIPDFFILGFGILAILLTMTVIIYFPLIYMIVIKLIRGEKAKNKVDTSFRPDAGDNDELDDL